MRSGLPRILNQLQLKGGECSTSHTKFSLESVYYQSAEEESLDADRLEYLSEMSWYEDRAQYYVDTLSIDECEYLRGGQHDLLGQTVAQTLTAATDKPNTENDC
jgi:hypothetical protein